jgi:hypothetical protein
MLGERVRPSEACHQNILHAATQIAVVAGGRRLGALRRLPQEAAPGHTLHRQRWRGDHETRHSPAHHPFQAEIAARMPTLVKKSLEPRAPISDRRRARRRRIKDRLERRQQRALVQSAPVVVGLLPSNALMREGTAAS